MHIDLSILVPVLTQAQGHEAPQGPKHCTALRRKGEALALFSSCMPGLEAGAVGGGLGYWTGCKHSWGAGVTFFFFLLCPVFVVTWAFL